MRATLIAMLMASAASAQTRVPAARIGVFEKYFEPRPDERRLRCDVFPVRPFLGFTLRFQSGYEVRVPLSQYPGEGHRWTVVIRVTPQGGEPAYFVQRFRLGKIPKTKVETEVGGAWMMGEGSYTVEWVMLDDSGRVYRKNWRIEARLRRSDRGVKPAMPPGTASSFSMAVQPARQTADAPPRHLTILLHAAPISLGRTRLRTADLFLLFTGLTSLLERLPAQSVKLVIFNLDQQREVFRRENFTTAELEQALDSMSGLQLGVVDYSVLKNRGGAVDLLTDLVEEERHAATPSDTVILLGPATRIVEALPHEAGRDAQGPAPRFYYFQYSPDVFGWSASTGGRLRINPLPFDIVSRLMARLQGKTFPIRTPGEFAKAIEVVAR